MMNRVKALAIIGLTIFLSACGNNIYEAKQSHFEELEKLPKKTFQFSDFDVYAFNICENYGEKVDRIERFCDCPDNFFEQSKEKELRKVEEVYLLMHQHSDLVLYLTTFSHKHIYDDQTGFLNDKAIYQNTILLRDLEFIYIGQQVSAEQAIYFENSKEGEEPLIWHYIQEKNADFLIKKVNVPTAENEFSSEVPIDLKDVFTNAIRFKKSSFEFYYSREKKHQVNDLFLVKQGTKMELWIKTDQEQLLWYRSAAKQIPYHPKFETIGS